MAFEVLKYLIVGEAADDDDVESFREVEARLHVEALLCDAATRRRLAQGGGRGENPNLFHVLPVA
jgi:hypothetical protein